jgi:hypothetical protein
MVTCDVFDMFAVLNVSERCDNTNKDLGTSIPLTSDAK